MISTDRKGQALPLAGLALVLSLAFFTTLVFLILKYQVDVPYMEDWLLVPLLEKFYQGKLTWMDLFQQQNEHRIPLPKAPLLALIVLTHWDTTTLLFFNLTVAIGIYVVFYRQIRRTLLSINDPGSHGWLLFLALFVFSFQQRSNWLWATQVYMFLNIFLVTLGIFTLGSVPFRARHFLASLFLGVAATYSGGANGMLFWPIGWVQICVKPLTGKWPKRIYLSLWAVVGSLSIGSYAIHYHPLPYDPPLWTFIQEPFAYFGFFFTWMGLPLVSFYKIGAFLAGVGGVALFGITSLTLIRLGRFSEEALRPYLALGAYGIGSALVIAIGRFPFGSPMVSRYVTLSYPFWIVNLLFLYLLLREPRIQSNRLGFGGCMIPFLTILFLTPLSSVAAVKGFRDSHRRLSEARSALYSLNDEKLLLRRLLPNPNTDQLKDGVAILRKYRLSLFRSPKPS